eukprot:10966652-Lingulodinium_polyedra.AAC.1
MSPVARDSEGWTNWPRALSTTKAAPTALGTNNITSVRKSTTWPPRVCLLPVGRMSPDPLATSSRQ